ncbi:MAG: Nicotinate phosphoribosyltransferase [Parcubacteria group bacterium GW2011_GWF2_38_76]|nr:MAG: Nicotinate phosphoribosyltransferase [Parcubacteria group bacterium GW2011_GWF2_38_76]HBM45968.1 nicotinate phosphoribosyltransferase [Patescibacteria group bacterium]
MEPIIKSLLDVDFYKFTMGQLVFNKYPDTVITYAFKNRTKGIRLADHVNMNELRRELDHVKTLHFNKTEIHYLRGTNEYQDRMFSESYLSFLSNLKLPDYKLEILDGDIGLKFSGKWVEVIYWETLALSIVNELYYRSLLRKMSKFERECVYAVMRLKLAEKIKKLKSKPDITFTDFGTRRRFNKSVQDYVVETLIDELPASQFLGTSNTFLAMKHGILPMGTNAHEIFMIVAGLMGQKKSDEGILNSVDIVLNDWWNQYGWGLSIALPDTFGSDFFLKQMTVEQARNWKGFRHDSGDPIEFGEKIIKFYQYHGIDPTSKLIVFSDGLDIDLIIKIADHFKGRIKYTFGWGTNLTNDLGFLALSLVIKAILANGEPLVKLSDNLAKAIGEKLEVSRYKRVCGYTNNVSEECRY